MPSISPSQLPNFVMSTAYGIISEEYEDRTELYRAFCEAMPETALEDFPFGTRDLGMVGAMVPRRRNPGEKFAMNTAGEGYARQLAYHQYGGAISIPDEMLEAENAQGRVGNLVRKMVRDFTRRWPTIKDTQVAGILQKGTLTAGSADYFNQTYSAHVDPNPLFIYDGQPFFDTAHPVKFGTGTYSNHTASLALTAANLDTVLTTMTTTNAVDENGTRITIRPSHLIVPRALQSTAMEILESQLKPGGANNDINALAGALQLLTFDLLEDDTDAWWVCEAGRGITTADSGAPKILTRKDADTRSTIVEVDARFGAAVTDWRYWYAANKAAS